MTPLCSRHRCLTSDCISSAAASRQTRSCVSRHPPARRAARTLAAAHSGASQPDRDVELTTQVSLDRWPRFSQQARAWGGPSSVAVYIPVPPGHPLAPDYLAHASKLATELRRDLADIADDAVPPQGRNRERLLPPARLTVTPVYASGRVREGAGVLGPHVRPTSDDDQPTSYERLYPINALRNAAVRAATGSSHVLLVDGDFIPSRGLREALLLPEQGSLLDLSDAHPRPVMWVLPAFELASTASPTATPTTSATTSTDSRAPAAVAAREVPDSEAARVPRTVAELAEVRAASLGDGGSKTVTRSGSGSRPGSGPGAGLPGRGGDDGGLGGGGLQLRPFHCGRYPQPLPTVDFEAWWGASLQSLGVASGPRGAAGGGGGSSDSAAGAAAGRASSRSEAAAGGGSDARWLPLQYHEYFEPYGIVRRDQVPLYDERFRGYGLNKVQQAYGMAAAGYEFRLLTDHFCVTVPHARSPSFKAAFGTAADPQQRARVEALYERFKDEMYEQYGYRFEAKMSSEQASELLQPKRRSLLGKALFGLDAVASTIESGLGAGLNATGAFVNRTASMVKLRRTRSRGPDVPEGEADGEDVGLVRPTSDR
ncbi:hypothetical protein HYH03_014149 [Edaphochlamys debaryana]|uniref:Uncharacterized protein n=1 Tax=Edaphochlamys debaryana TaxID=47281 RepID=A0A836BSI4_9CHLO|nr:hypothetical protein HYH03_014149 [Edaphochlamys debaryana]|eukprot:KAG2487167.1 hypothetical protein HYH03_014149 [Edaphochlamys debaryana]